MLALAVAAICAFGVFVHAARPLNSPAPALAEIERILDLAGFGLTQVSVTGHRYTPDSDILDAVGLGSALTLLTFDSRVAKARIEALPWVERASIERVLPDRLEVRVTERTPFAIWSRDGRYYLIDKSGRVLAPVPAGALPPLPKVAGAGAGAEAAGLLAILAAHPELGARVRVAERISRRRWMLRLIDGSSVQLPARDVAEALDRAQRIAATGGMEGKEIDVRIAGRTLVRAPEGSSALTGTAATAVAGGT
jgi:cell division protein FtsQ